MRGRATRAVALAAVLVAVAVAFADSSIVVIALPDVLRRFDTSITGVAWVVTAYNLALAATALVLVRVRMPAPRRLKLGLVLFLVSSAACGAAPDIWALVAFRTLQGIGGALLLTGSLPAVRALSPRRGSALWTGAGIFGAALGPAAGGVLTEILSWRAIFYAQAPVAAVALLATARLVFADAPVRAESRRRRRVAANAALGLVSAALVGLLFLAVVLLIDVWRLSPLTAAAVVSTIPLATLAAQPLAGRAVAAGLPLLAGGLAGMALLPARSVAWAVVVLAVAGFGLGLAMPALTRAALGANAAWTVWARHAGLVLGLLVLTPLLSNDLQAGAESAKLRATAAILDAQLPAETKLRLAFDMAPILSHPPDKQIPDFTRELTKRGQPQLGKELDSIVAAVVTRSFRTSFLIAALLAACAIVPFAIAVPLGGRRTLRTAAVAAAVGAALVGAELARGALTYGQHPEVLPPCAARASYPGSGVDPAAQRAVLKSLDFVACHVHKSREQLVVDLAGAGVDAVDFVGRLAGYAGALPGWLARLLTG
jgi:predicted MFS family arabinose efflux permease